jgi:chromosome partitioning protein
MGAIIAVANQKGGVGKTTTANALLLGLKHRGARVLGIDLDPQGNFSFSLAAERENSPTSYHVLTKAITAKEAIQQTPLCDVIPANIMLSSIQTSHFERGWEFILRDALKELASVYDYIILDTPPALSVLTINAFVASEGILVPLLADIFSLQGLTQLNDTIVRVRDYCNKNLHVLGVVLTRFTYRTILGREIRKTARMVTGQLGFTLLETQIRASVAIMEAQSMQADMYEYMPENAAVQDYDRLINELITKRGL